MNRNRCIIPPLIVVAALATVSGWGQDTADPWLILASGEKGGITLDTTRADLVRKYGAANVVDRDVDVGEGEMESATFLFPNDSERQIEILWKDPETKTAPESADVLARRSRWHGPHGITIGTSAVELERLNGRPFHFALTNDGTDMAQETISWRRGRLEKEFQGDGGIIMEMQWSPRKGAKPKGPSDIEVNSDNSVWRAQNPHITRMTWIFPSNTEH